jgi:hypothetical protein
VVMANLRRVAAKDVSGAEPPSGTSHVVEQTRARTRARGRASNRGRQRNERPETPNSMSTRHFMSPTTSRCAQMGSRETESIPSAGSTRASHTEGRGR